MLQQRAEERGETEPMAHSYRSNELSIISDVDEAANTSREDAAGNVLTRPSMEMLTCFSQSMRTTLPSSQTKEMSTIPEHLNSKRTLPPKLRHPRKNAVREKSSCVVESVVTPAPTWLRTITILLPISTRLVPSWKPCNRPNSSSCLTACWSCTTSQLRRRGVSSKMFVVGVR